MATKRTPEPMTTCARCGQVHERCSAHNGRGLPCGIRPVLGAVVCQVHGASAPQVRAAAARRVAADRAVAAAAMYGAPVITSAEDALLDLVHRTYGHVVYMAAMIAAFKSESELVDAERGVPSVWLALYADERRNLAHFAKACLDSRIADRQVSLAEGQGQQLASVLNAVIGGILAALAAHVADDVLSRLRRDVIPAVVHEALAPLTRSAAA